MEKDTPSLTPNFKEGLITYNNMVREGFFSCVIAAWREAVRLYSLKARFYRNEIMSGNLNIKEIDILFIVFNILFYMCLLLESYL